MMILAVALGAIIGGLIVVAATVLVRGDFPVRTPRALDPEYRHHEVVACGLLVGILLKLGTAGAGVGALVALLVFWLAF